MRRVAAPRWPAPARRSRSAAGRRRPQSTDPVEIEAVLAGQDVATADSKNPIKIEPEEEIPLLLTMRNTSDDTVTVRYVRLEGTALGLTFLTYDLGVRTTLAPGEQTTLDATLDFFDLESQATGYLGTSLRVLRPGPSAPRLGGLRRRRAGQRHLHPRPVRDRRPRRGDLLHDRARAQHPAPPAPAEPLRAGCAVRDRGCGHRRDAVTWPLDPEDHLRRRGGLGPSGVRSNGHRVPPRLPRARPAVSQHPGRA